VWFCPDGLWDQGIDMDSGTLKVYCNGVHLKRAIVSGLPTDEPVHLLASPASAVLLST
jgi:hypothetical protein